MELHRETERESEHSLLYVHMILIPVALQCECPQDHEEVLCLVTFSLLFAAMLSLNESPI